MASLLDDDIGTEFNFPVRAGNIGFPTISQIDIFSYDIILTTFSQTKFSQPVTFLMRDKNFSTPHFLTHIFSKTRLFPNQEILSQTFCLFNQKLQL